VGRVREDMPLVDPYCITTPQNSRAHASEAEASQIAGRKSTASRDPRVSSGVG
jgi:hypothetical protein